MRKRRAILIGLVSLVLLNLAFSSVAQAAPAQISVSPASIEVSHGEAFTIEIEVDPKGNEVYGAQYGLYFNNNLLEALTQTQGTFLSQDGAETNVFVNETNNTIGRIVYGEARTGTISGVSTPGTLASISFKVIGTSGTSDQKLSNVKLTNPNAEIIEIEIKEGICSIGKVTDEPVVTDKTVEEAHRMMEEEPGEIILLDVQTEEEYEAEHIDMPKVELKNIPKNELESRLDELDKTKKIIVYCRTGSGSRTASEILIQNGFENVYNMLGGIEAWRLHRDFPVSTAPALSPSPTPVVSPTPTPVPTSTPAIGGFEAVLAMTMLAISYFIFSSKRRRSNRNE